MDRIIRRRTAWLLAVLLLAALVMPGPAAAEKFSPADAAEGRKQALALLETCAFSGHLADQERGMLIRWGDPMTIYADGAPTRSDLSELDSFLTLLAFRVPELPPIRRVDNPAEANVVIHYLKLSEIRELETGYVEGNWGFQTYTYHADGQIFKAQIWLARDKTGLAGRTHMMREGLVSILGLTNVHTSYTDSILHQGWSTRQNLSEVDWLMLNMVYSAHVSPGWSWPQTRDALSAFYQLTPEAETP